MARFTLCILVAALLVALVAPPAQAIGPVKLVNLPLTLKYAPVWSNQEDRLAYVVADGLYTISRTGASLTKIYAATTGQTLGRPTFSADGRYLAFVEGDRLVVVNSYTGALAPSLPVPGNVSEPLYSPDGRFLFATWSDPDNDYGLLLDLAAGRTRTFDGFVPTAARFSPDGRNLYFIDSAAYQVVYRVNLDNPDLSSLQAEALFDIRQFPSFGSLVLAFDLSASGDRFAFLADTPLNAPYSLYTIDQAAGETRFQTSNVKEFDMSSSGQVAYISHTDFALDQIDLSYASYRNIDWGKVQNIRFSPEEDSISYVKFSATSKQLWLYNFQNHSAPAVPAAPQVTGTAADAIDIALPATDGLWYRITIDGVPGPCVPAASTTYHLAGLAAATTYQIQLSALQYGYESALSPATPAATGAAAPPAPTGLFASEVAVESFRVSFTTAGEFAAYRIFLDGAQVAETTQKFWDFANLHGATAYTVAVVCVNGEFASAPLSAPVTTLPYPPFAPVVSWPVADGAMLSASPALEVAVTAPFLAGFETLLDGAPLASGQVAADGAHTLAVRATDRGGQASESTRGFTVDSVPPEILFVNFATGDEKRPGFVPEIAVVEDHPAGFALFVDGVAVDPSAVALPEGTHSLRVEARDLAGNVAGRDAVLAIAWPPIAFATLSLAAPVVDFGREATLGVTTGFDLAGLAGTLELAVRRGDATLVALVLPLEAGRVAADLGLALLDPTGAPLPGGDYLLVATLTDARGRSAAAPAAAFTVRAPATFACTELPLDRALLFAHSKDQADAKAVLAALGLPYELAAQNTILDRKSESGRFGIYLVHGNRVSAFLRDRLYRRVQSGDLLVVFDAIKGKKGQRVSTTTYGDGLIVKLEALDAASLADAIARRDSGLATPDPRFAKSRKFRVEFKRNGVAAASTARVDIAGLSLEQGMTPLATGATVAIPAGGATFYTTRADDLVAARATFTTDDGLTARIDLAPLPSLGNAAADLVNLLATLDLRTVLGRGCKPKAILLGRALFGVLDIDLQRLRLGSVNVRCLGGILALIERYEKRLFPEVARAALALDLRIDKNLVFADPACKDGRHGKDEDGGDCDRDHGNGNGNDDNGHGNEDNGHGNGKK